MAPTPTIMQAVEKLGYRVTIGDVAAQAGLDVNLARQGLLALASDAGGHLQVAESGEVVYLFPKNFRSVLQSKYFRLQLKEWWEKVWRVLFYLIRISFGIILILSIILIVVAIVIIITAMSSSRDNDDRSDSGSSGGIFLPNFWVGPDFFWFFYPDYDDRRRERRVDRQRSRSGEKSKMNFLEAIFSFIFGDGNPNTDLEDRRWKTIGAAIRSNRGAVIAEQIAPYLESTGQGYAQEYEEYMLPVLARFNGLPEVSPDGEIVYHFPELQAMAARKRPKSVPTYLEEQPWRFSEAESGQLILAAGLGAFNLIGAIVLGALLADGTAAAQIGGLVVFVQSIYGVLLAYGLAFLGIPLIRYFWIQWRNQQIAARNQTRRARSLRLSKPDATLQRKLTYADQFAAETVINKEDLVYTTETDLLEQEVNQSERTDAEWQRRLNQSGS